MLENLFSNKIGKYGEPNNTVLIMSDNTSFKEKLLRKCDSDKQIWLLRISFIADWFIGSIRISCGDQGGKIVEVVSRYYATRTIQSQLLKWPPVNTA